MNARNGEAPDPPVGRGQGKGANRLEPGFAHDFDGCRKPRLPIQSSKHKRFLISENPGCDGFFPFHFGRAAMAGLALPSEMPVHLVRFLIELRDAVEWN